MRWIIGFLITSQVFAHGGKTHSTPGLHKVDDAFIEAYKSINQDYKLNVEAIFKGKCFDCHSSQTSYPWYYKIPGINLIINSHIKEARSHLDMTNGFPFKSHENPLEDLKEIGKAVEKESMPPWFYTPLHANSKLDKNEKVLILQWISSAQKKLMELK